MSRPNEVEPVWKNPNFTTRKTTKRIRPVSEKRRSESATRKAFAEAVRAHYSYECQGPNRGLPGACSQYDYGRHPLDVHEPDQRSTHPGSHVRSTLAVPLCHAHHAYVTSPSGEALEIVTAAGLLVRATDEGVLGPREAS